MTIRTVIAATALAFALTGFPATAQRADPVPEVEGPIVGPVSREHQTQIEGRPLSYRSVFREYALSGSAGEPLATISATAYVASGSAAADRPVFFFFNGGPGASSSPLHFSAFGPRIRAGGSRGDAPFINNPNSPLDIADLVFIDPVGTGFSRVLPGGSGESFWSPLGDAGAVMQLIRNWLRDEGRSGAPVFIAGESYGGFRLATMMRDAEGLNLQGLVLISPMLDASSLAGAADYDRSYIFRLPSMAAAAWYHEKVDRRGFSAEQFFDQAAEFAESDYLVALHKGSALPEDEKRRIAGRMAELIGLSAQEIVEEDLRVSPDLFVQALLRDRNMTIGRLDARVAAPVRPPAREDRPSAANDPSLGLGATNVIRSPAITRYMRDELGVPVERDYVSLTLDVNFRWDWRERIDDPALYYNPLGNVARRIEERPDLMIMVVGGIYDLATPITGARHAIRHSEVPLDRVTFVELPAGHSPFEETETRARLSERVRSFVREATSSAD